MEATAEARQAVTAEARQAVVGERLRQLDEEIEQRAVVHTGLVECALNELPFDPADIRS